MKYLKYISLSAVLMLSGCSSFLKEYSQDTDYVNSWKDLNETLIGQCYMPQFSSSFLSSVSDNQYFIHFLGDELTESVDSYNGSASQYDGKEKVFGLFTWQARSGQNDTYTGFNAENANWTECYKYINVANNILYSLGEVPQKTDAEKLGALKVDGEARFLRAYYYFWLVNLYGKPYVASTAKTDLGVAIKTSEKVEDKYFVRNTVQECYDLILSDLLQAETDLAQYGAQPSVYRADVSAVRFLLSRVYLYMQNWTKASEYAQKVLDVHSDLVQLNNLKSGAAFLSPTSVETIFSMGSNSLPCFTVHEFKGFKISDDIYNMYSNDDLRKTKFMWHNGTFQGYTKLEVKGTNLTVGSDDPSYYFNAYSNAWDFNRSDMSDKFAFRTAEAYLIKAEAEAYLVNEDMARALINKLRSYRYANGTNYTVTATGEDLVKLIRDERERELLLEGQRWFDLRRYGVCEKYPESKRIVHDYYYYESRYSTTKTGCHRFVLEPNDWGYTLPIPNDVLEFNNMKNNQRGNRTYTVVPLN
jgi:SusD family.